MTSIIWSDAARRDFEGIWRWTDQNRGAEAAGRIGRRIVEAILGLVDFPKIGRPGRKIGTRELVVSRTPYIVVYMVRPRQVRIVRVIHGRQDWPRKKPRR